MFKQAARITVIFYMFSGLAIARQADASDPCEAAFRAGCGRLVVAVLAAGEKSNENPYKPSDTRHKTFKPTDWDALEFDTYYSTKQFSPKPDSKLPVQVMAISSDEALNSRFKDFVNGSNSQFVGASKIALKHTKGEATPQAKFAEAIKNFEKDPNCQRLMQDFGYKSVLPLIKVEYLINSEFSHMDDERPGIPAWSDDAKSGNMSKWWDDGQCVVGKEQWDSFTSPVQGAVEQTFINSCNATRIGMAFEEDRNSSTCKCFVAATAGNQAEVGGGGHKHFLNYAMDDYGAANHSFANPNSWQGADSALGILPKLYEKHRAAIFFDGPVANNPRAVIEYKNTKNPLLGFVYTSLDGLADASLKKLSGLDKRALEVLEAQTMAEMPPLVEVKNPSIELSNAMSQIADLERMYKPYLAEEDHKTLNTAEHNKHILAFADCTNGGQESNPNDDFCKKFSEYKTSIYKKQKPSKEEIEFKEAYGNFVPNAKEIGLRTLWSKYAAKEISLAEVFTGLQKLWDSYTVLKQAMSSLSFKQSGTRQVDADVEKAFSYMTENFEKAYASVRNQVFEELRREAMQVKIARMKHAAQMAEQYAASLPAGFPGTTSSGFLKRMSSKFNCLSQYAVGPRYDEVMPGTKRMPLLTQSGMGSKGGPGKEHSKDKQPSSSELPALR